jgi:hypothetical protein
VTTTKIVHTNGSDEVVAGGANLIIGRAAYETSRRLYPNERVDYRDGARILATSAGTKIAVSAAAETGDAGGGTAAALRRDCL